MEKEKVFAMSVAKVYPLLVAKAERKGRTKEEVDQVTCWLTGYTKKQLDSQIERDIFIMVFLYKKKKRDIILLWHMLIKMRWKLFAL